jgi:hypothetical protein
VGLQALEDQQVEELEPLVAQEQVAQRLALEEQVVGEVDLLEEHHQGHNCLVEGLEVVDLEEGLEEVVEVQLEEHHQEAHHLPIELQVLILHSLHIQELLGDVFDQEHLEDLQLLQNLDNLATYLA